MMGRFRRAMNYWIFSVSHPGYVLEIAQKDMHRVRISFYIVIVFGLMYSFTSWMLWMGKRTPLMESWVPGVPSGSYYLYQMFWTVPWMVVAWLGVAGFIYLFTVISGKEAYYEDSLMISAISVTIPYLMFWWIPETFLLPAMGHGASFRWPELFELERKFIFPGIWQLFLVGFGMRKLNNTNRVACLAAGLFSVLTFFVLYLPYMR